MLNPSQLPRTAQHTPRGRAASLAALTILSLAATSRAQLLVGADEGGASLAARYSSATIPDSFSPFPGSAGGARVAVGDVNGDGVNDLIFGAGPGSTGPLVKIIDGTSNTIIFSFFAYGPSFTGGVFVAAGDVNGDGRLDIITGPGAGGTPHVKVFDGRTGAEIRSFFPFPPSFAGGVRVAAGDVNGDGFADIIAGAGPGGGPLVSITDGTSNTIVTTFSAYAPSFTGGVFVAAGDLNGDGRDEIITGPGAGSSPTVNVFDPANPALNQSFLVGPADNLAGVHVGTHVGSNGIIAILIGLLTSPTPTVQLRTVTGGFIRGGSFDASLFTGTHVFVAGAPRALCRADFNHDRNLDPDDLGDFITCYFSHLPCARADFNTDGDTNPDDLGDFITAYFHGCG